MPDLRDNRNIIDKSFEIFTKVQVRNGQSPPDEVSFVGGFMTCFGVIVGHVDIGLDMNAPLDKILDNIHKDIASFGQRVMENQAKQDNLDARIKQAVDSMKPPTQKPPNGG